MKGYERGMSRGKPERQEIITQTLRLKSAPLTVDGLSGVGFGVAVIGDLPQGNILLLGAIGYLKATKLVAAGTLDTFNPTFSLGSAPTADATLSGAEIDLLPATAAGASTAGVSPLARIANATQVMLDNTDDSLEVNLNVTIPDADMSAAGQTFTVDGFVQLKYCVMLDD